MMETVIHLVILLIASGSLAVPLIWAQRSSWFDPMVLFGSTVFVFAFGKHLYLTLAGDADDQPAWAIAADLHTGVWATLLFCALSVVGYVLVRTQFRSEETTMAHGSVIDMRIIYLISLFFVAVSLLAFFTIFSATSLSFSFDAISAKRFLDEVMGPASRIGTFEYFLFRATLAARIPMYAVFVGALMRKKLYPLDVAILVICFLAIAATAFVFSNRFNLLLVFVDLIAILVVVGRHSIKLRHMVLGAMVFGAMLVVSELRLSEGQTRSILEHVYYSYYFADVARTDQVIEYYDTNEKIHGASLYNWLFIVFPRSYTDGGEAYLNMGWDLGYHVFGRHASGVPPGFLAETYMNFGWPGLLAGGFLFGVVAAYIIVMLQRRSLPPWFLLFLTLISVRIGLVMFNGNFGMAMIKIGLEALPAALLVWLATRTRIRAPTVHVAESAVVRQVS